MTPHRGHKKSRFGATAAVLALVALGCGGKSTAANGPVENTVDGIPNQVFQPNNTATPKPGGTLTMLGTSDVDFMDPNISYTTVGSLNLRMWSRQLYTYPAVPDRTISVAPDLAKTMPTISDGGLKYVVTIRSGVMWNAPTGARPVVAADVVRGVKRSCNPSMPFGGQPDFADVLAGYADFCAGFANVSASSATAQKAYMDGHNISGVSVDPSDRSGLTVVFTLIKPASYFTDILTLTAFAPAPVEYEDYLPASPELASHTISDGPYEVRQYVPARQIIYERNPVWKPSTDPIRKAYVDKIVVTETGNQSTIQLQISTNTPEADMTWDAFVPPDAVPGLISSRNPNFNAQSSYALTEIAFNTASPNNGAALQQTEVRQALEFALDRGHLIQDMSGPKVSPPLTQILPAGTVGHSPGYDLYPFNPAKARQILAAAGVSHLSLKMLYRPSIESDSKMFQTVQADLGGVGINVVGVGVPSADLITKYFEVPAQAKAGAWDLAELGWSPDWFGDSAKSFFEPLFDGRTLPPASADIGLFSDPVLDSIIDRAATATTQAASGTLWHAADTETMKQAATFPVADENIVLMRGSQVHNWIYLPYLQQADPTNVWLQQ